jgi:hypothetical protein
MVNFQRSWSATSGSTRLASSCGKIARDHRHSQNMRFSGEVNGFGLGVLTQLPFHFFGLAVRLAVIRLKPTPTVRPSEFVNSGRVWVHGA